MLSRWLKYFLFFVFCSGWNLKRNELQLTFNILSRNNKIPSTKTLSATKIIQHPSYSPYTLQNDVAVIETSEQITDAFDATPICLASKPVSGGEQAMVSGFGTTSSGMLFPRDLKIPQLKLSYEVLKKLLHMRTQIRHTRT